MRLAPYASRAALLNDRCWPEMIVDCVGPGWSPSVPSGGRRGRRGRRRGRGNRRRGSRWRGHGRDRRDPASGRSGGRWRRGLRGVPARRPGRPRGCGRRRARWRRRSRLELRQYRTARAQPVDGLLVAPARLRAVVTLVAQPESDAPVPLRIEVPVSERMGHLVGQVLHGHGVLPRPEHDAEPAVETRAYLVCVHSPRPQEGSSARPTVFREDRRTGAPALSGRRPGVDGHPQHLGHAGQGRAQRQCDPGERVPVATGGVPVDDQHRGARLRGLADEAEPGHHRQ